jgi:hypothetical protein
MRAPADSSGPSHLLVRACVVVGSGMLAKGHQPQDDAIGDVLGKERHSDFLKWFVLYESWISMIAFWCLPVMNSVYGWRQRG